MSWNDQKVNKLKELWGKGNTASQIAEIIGGISRNAVIGKAHRLNLSAKIKTRAATSNQSFENSQIEKNNNPKLGRKSKFKSLIIEKILNQKTPNNWKSWTKVVANGQLDIQMKSLFIFVEDHPLKIFLIANYIFYMLINLKEKKKKRLKKKKCQNLLKRKFNQLKN